MIDSIFSKNDKSEERLWSNCNEQLKQTEIEFFNQMITQETKNKRKTDSPRRQNENSLIKWIDEEKDNVQINEGQLDIIPILCAKCIYNSYLK